MLENCLVEWNDWTTIGGCIPGQFTGSSTLCLDGKSDNVQVRRLTMRKNGRSAGLRPVRAANSNINANCFLNFLVKVQR